MIDEERIRILSEGNETARWAAERIKELQEQLIARTLSETTIREMSIKNGGLNLAFEGGAAQVLVESFSQQFINFGAKNYLELTFTNDALGDMYVTLQRVNGLTPCQKLAAAQSELAVASAGITEVFQLIENSVGVYGLGCRDADYIPQIRDWSDILKGGIFEGLLSNLEAASEHTKSKSNDIKV